MAVKANMLGPHAMDLGDENELVRVCQLMNTRIFKGCFIGAALTARVVQRVNEERKAAGRPDSERMIGVVRFWTENMYGGNMDTFKPLRNYVVASTLGRNLVDFENEKDTWGDKFNPDYAVQLWYNHSSVKGEIDHLKSLPASVKECIFVSSFNENEKPGYEADGVTRRQYTGGGWDYYRFEARRAAFLEGFGLRAALVALNVGHDFDWDAAEATGLIQAANHPTVNKHAFEYHAYMGGGIANTGHGDFQADFPDGRIAETPQWHRHNREVLEPSTPKDSWAAWRIIHWLRHPVLKRFPNTMFLGGEGGFDDAFGNMYRWWSAGGASIGSWKSCIETWRQLGFLIDKTPEQYMAEEYAYAERQFRKFDKNLYGVVLFTYGAAVRPPRDWTWFDHRGPFLNGNDGGVLVKELNKIPWIDGAPVPQPEQGCWVTPNPLTATATNIRKLPYFPQGEKILTLAASERLKAVAIAHTINPSTGERPDWIKVQLADGSFGWGHSFYLSITCQDAQLPLVPAPLLDGSTDCAAVEAELAQVKANRDELLGLYQAVEAERNELRGTANNYRNIIQGIQDLVCDHG